MSRRSETNETAEQALRGVEELRESLAALGDDLNVRVGDIQSTIDARLNSAVDTMLGTLREELSALRAASPQRQTGPLAHGLSRRCGSTVASSGRWLALAPRIVRVAASSGLGSKAGSFGSAAVWAASTPLIG